MVIFYVQAQTNQGWQLVGLEDGALQHIASLWPLSQLPDLAILLL